MTIKVVPKAICDSENCSESWLCNACETEELSIDSKGTPEKSFNAAFRKIFRIT